MTTDKIILFVEREQLTEDALRYLGDQVEIRPYNSFFEYLKELTLSLELDNEWVSLFDTYPSKTAYSRNRKSLSETELALRWQERSAKTSILSNVRLSMT